MEITDPNKKKPYKPCLRDTIQSPEKRPEHT